MEVPYLHRDDVVVYLRGTAEHPLCGYSERLVEILRQTGVRFVAVDVEHDDALREAVIEYSGWPSMPQLFAEGEFLGGPDVLEEMHRSGALAERLRDLPRAPS